MASPREEPSALERLRRLDEADLEARRTTEAGRTGPAGRTPSRASAPRRGLLGTLVAVVLLALTKGKAILLLLASKGGLLLGALNLGKIALTLSTMGASFLWYAGQYSWSFALGFVVLILVHELGHGLAARRLGLRVGAPIFIPGFGAVIALKDQPRSTWVSAVVGYGGPLAGTLGGLAVWGGGRLLAPGHAGLTDALAHFTFLINLFNLLPVGGLDGDRITEPVTVRQWTAGLAALAVVATLSARSHETRPGTTNPQILFALAILILGVVKTLRVRHRIARARAGAHERLLDRLTGPQAHYTEEASVEPWQRRTAAIGYFGLAGLLLVLAILSELPAR